MRDWEGMPPAKVRAYMVRRTQIEAEEKIAATLIAMFHYPAQSKEDLDYRLEILEEWQIVASGRDPWAERGDYYQRGGTVYVKTAEAMKRALRQTFRYEKERKLFAVETPPEGEDDE